MQRSLLLFPSVSLFALATALSPTTAAAQATQPVTATPPSVPQSSTQDDDPAQTPEQKNDVAATAAEVATPLETGSGDILVVVTGSRIARPEFAFPNPIQSFGAASIEQSGDTNITDFLADTPALSGSSTSSETSGSNGFFQSAGLNLLNLRNLGTNRTLVLVNGRRHVAAYPGTSSVDVNTIPTDLIDRVDILTGGTSAIYGADGVSGVVNFVMKRDFEGLRVRGQSGISELGDAGNKFGSVTVGKNFAGNRANVALSYEYNQSDRLDDTDRSFTGDPFKRFELLRQAPPTDRPDVLDIPDRVLFNDVRWADSSRDGAIDFGGPDCSDDGEFILGCFDAIPEFTGSGGVYDRGILLPGSGGRTIGGSGTTTAGYFGDFLPYLRRHNVNALASFEVSPALRIFAEGKYVRTKAFTISQPSFDFGTFLAPDNAFLVERFGPDAAPEGALISRDNFDLGVRGDTSRRKTIRGVIGADGKISDHARYEVSFTYGQAKAATTSSNDRVSDRYFAALDSVVNPANGQITCRINLPGETIVDPNNFGEAPSTFAPGACVPLNLLGDGVASQDAVDFVTQSHTTNLTIDQKVLSGSVSGDLGQFFELPGGPIGFAVGAEYRKEKSRSVPSELIQNGSLLDSSEIEVSSGKFDAKEVFAEVNVPLLKDLPFAKTLSFGAAGRLSDYSTIGKTKTWKVDGVYAPIKDITFRATLSQAVRAPNISELFDPVSGTFEFITDPCDQTNLGSGASTRTANCAAILSGLGFTPAEIAAFSPSTDGEASTSQLGLAGGNPNLREETARTWTAGVVLRPRFIPGLTAAFDYYHIKLKDAVNQATATDIAALCVDAATIDNVFCPNITRDPNTGFITSFNASLQNVANFTTAGVDMTLNYRFTPSPALGTFNLRVVGGHLTKLEFISSPGADIDIDVGEPASPKWIGVGDLTWTKGPWSVNYGLSWFSKTRRFTTEQLTGNPDLSDPKFFFYKEKWEHDFQISRSVGERFNMYLGVNNFTDEKPSVSSGGNYPVSAVGRFFYAGVKVGLDKLF